MRAPLPKQSSSSAREEERQWTSVDDNRKWVCRLSRVRPKGLLKYIENSKDLKVSLGELKEQLETPEEVGFSIVQIAPTGKE